MTEIGMALSNPLRDQNPRSCWSLPGVKARIVRWTDSESGYGVLAGGGQQLLCLWISVKRDCLSVVPCLSEYLNKPEATRKNLEDGWFKTGDTAKRLKMEFQNTWRTSVDIIKSGGYKISVPLGRGEKYC